MIETAKRYAPFLLAVPLIAGFGALVLFNTSQDSAEVAIYWPRDGAVLQVGDYTVTGAANSAHFVEFRLEQTHPRASEAHDGWLATYSSGVPVRDGARGHLGSLHLPGPGTYEIRLVVEDAERGELIEQIQVTVE